MAEPKPFEATPSRLERARREGDVLRSADLGAVAALGAALAVLPLVATPLSAATQAALVEAALHHRILVGAYEQIASLALGVPAAAIAGAALAGVLPAGGVLFRFPAAKFERLDPRGGLRRMLSRDTLTAAAKAALAAFALGFALVPVARLALNGDAAAAPGALAARTFDAALRCLAVALIAGASFACADLALERAKRRKRLRMSHDELKRDQKQSEGDPGMRGRRRQAHRALARGSLQRLGEAALVVTNPTHLALALAYRPPEVAVPRVLVRAAGEAAQRVKARARALGIPIVEDVALARALFASTDAGDFIPREAYPAVAAIVAALLRRGILPR